MSRSYKRPYIAVCGKHGAKEDKQLANRGVRRAHRRYLNQNWEEEDFLLPHRLECTHNEVWGWCRDGKQTYRTPCSRDWQHYVEFLNGWHTGGWFAEHYATWPPVWYQLITRK